MVSALFVVLVVGAAVAYVLRLPPAVEGLSVWLALALPYAGLAGLSAYRLQRQARLRELMRLRPGDLSLGIVIGVALVVSSWALARWSMPPGSVERGWLLRVALVLGGTSSPAVTVCLVTIGLCEELVWRGWVQTELGQQLGARGWIASTLVYAAAHGATLVTLRDDLAGPNPLVFLAALGCGLCWAFLRERTGRLLPGLFSHAAFTYLMTQYLWRFI
ncbi:MAG TPA: type II CAAX endopeptidase family protein [Polyangiaceae bacterium]|nr:type II CAAX endopeptidase family protein [Polyangiaceae bacterium]